jgi:hypothetical protein
MLREQEGTVGQTHHPFIMELRAQHFSKQANKHIAAQYTNSSLRNAMQMYYYGRTYVLRSCILLHKQTDFPQNRQGTRSGSAASGSTTQQLQAPAAQLTKTI